MSQTTAARVLARAGLVARGVIYLLIGWLAVELALGHSPKQPNQQGALQLLAGHSYGLITLWLLGIGFVGYSLWRLSEAAFGVAGEGRRAGPRLRSLARAVIYSFLAYLTFQVIAGAAGSQTRKQRDLTATLLREPGGPWIVGAIGLAIVIVGIVLIAEGLRRKFMRYLRTGAMGPRTRRIVERLGVVGSVARGIVVTIVGALVIDAAVTFSPRKSGGLDKALLTLRHQVFGEFLLLAVALGVLIFGLYGLCEARWHRVTARGAG